MTATFITCIVFMIIAIVVAIILAKKSNLIRDDISDLNAFKAAATLLPQFNSINDINKVPRPYSLSRTQILVWTIVIAGSYLYLRFLSGCPDCNEMTINPTALWLMGISAATAAAGAAIDSSQSNQPRHQNSPSEGFFKDILSDDNGINIHRFQNVLWTIICIGIYLYKLIHCPNNCQLPVLDDTIIALTGLSSATYATIKISENQ